MQKMNGNRFDYHPKKLSQSCLKGGVVQDEGDFERPKLSKIYPKVVLKLSNSWLKISQSCLKVIPKLLQRRCCAGWRRLWTTTHNEHNCEWAPDTSAAHNSTALTLFCCSGLGWYSIVLCIMSSALLFFYWNQMHIRGRMIGMQKKFQKIYS